MPLILLPNGSDYSDNGSTVAKTSKPLSISFNSPLQRSHEAQCDLLENVRDSESKKLDLVHRFF